MANIKVDIRTHNEIKGLYYINFVDVDDNDKVLVQIQGNIQLLESVHITTGNALDLIRSDEEKLRVQNN